MSNKLTLTTKVITAVCSVALFISIFTPLWKIELTAPQYPEGLILKIYPDKIGGNVDVINGLNHYIGMRTLHTEDFFEFVILPWLIGTIAFFGILTLIINRRWFFMAWMAFFTLFGITAMFDFYRWEYNYGHNLDHSAAIQVPGMYYQPPLIGYKKLLNFGAYSIPDLGGWIFIGVAIILIVALVVELRHVVDIKKLSILKKASATTLVVFTMTACVSGPEPIRTGVDACDFCKMTIADKKFSSELLTKKGKLYKFDDVHCLTSFSKSGKLGQGDIDKLWFTDFTSPNNFISFQEAVLLKDETLHSPMGGNVAAFTNKEKLNNFNKDRSGQVVTWEQIQQ